MDPNASRESFGKLMSFAKVTHHEPTPSLQALKLPAGQPHVVAVIGASRGIGEHIAYSYARAGATGIALLARSLDAMRSVATAIKEINSQCVVEIVSCDITSSSSTGAAAKTVKSKFGRLDTVVLNSGFAGKVILDPLEDDLAEVDTAFDINAKGTFIVAHAFVPLLLETRDGAKTFFATNTSGIALVDGPFANMKYTVSKLAQMKMLEYLHVLYGEQGLLVVGFQPGIVMTDMAKNSIVPGKEKETMELMSSFELDGPARCGAFMAAVSVKRDELTWAGGRLVSATWDFDEFQSLKDRIVEGDLLKSVVRT